LDCETGATIVVPCDDDDPNTENDMETILECDSSVCVPCLGEINTFFIPNAFSPNGDGLNETWFIPDINQFENNSLTIVDRWGNVIYEAKPYHNDWDGRRNNGSKLPEGTYYYLLQLDPDQDLVRKGAVTIIR